MKARQAINGAPFGPDALKVVGQAFDEAWAQIATFFGCHKYLLITAVVEIVQRILADTDAAAISAYRGPVPSLVQILSVAGGAVMRPSLLLDGALLGMRPVGSGVCLPAHRSRRRLRDEEVNKSKRAALGGRGGPFGSGSRPDCNAGRSDRG
jgi:hypothetical protein